MSNGCRRWVAKKNNGIGLQEVKRQKRQEEDQQSIRKHIKNAISEKGLQEGDWYDRMLWKQK